MSADEKEAEMRKKGKSNKVRDIFVARIEQLMSQYEESRTIKHGPTVGAMREAYLKNFLREVLPTKYSPVSGFIADMRDNITPQLDLIFADMSELPTVSLVNDTVIVPAEIVLMTAEVKSTIKSEDIDQVKEQRKAIDSLEPASLGMGRQRQLRCQTIIMAFDSDVGVDTLKKWVSEVTGLDGIYVFNKVSIFPALEENRFKTCVQKVTTTNNREQLLTFIGAIYRLLYLLSINNSPISDEEYKTIISKRSMPFWEGYLSGFLTDRFQSPT